MIAANVSALTIVIGMTAFMIGLRVLIWVAEQRDRKHPYRRRRFMNDYQRQLFALLRRDFSAKYLVLPQIHLAELLEVSESEAGGDAKLYLNRINVRALDFVIFDQAADRALLAIELDDFVHRLAHSVRADEYLAHALKAAGIDLMHIDIPEMHDPQKVLAKVSDHLRQV